MLRLRRFAIASLLAAQALLLAAGAMQHSPVMDEIAHLAAGISDWESGRFDLYKVNPPLIRMLAALPALLAGAETDYRSDFEGVGSRAEFAVADDFTRANGPRVAWLVMLARLGLIPVTLIGGWTCYRWAGELYGEKAAMLALALWCFSPNTLAYGHLLTADAGAAAIGAAANYFFWKWLRTPRWDCALVAGVVLGLAELTKTTWAVLFALWPAVWILWKFSLKEKTCEGAIQLAAILALGLSCVNAGYDFQGSCTPLRDYVFVSRPLTSANAGRQVRPFGNRFAKSWAGHIRVPLPKKYVEGIDLQWHDIELGKPSYLRGCWQDRGWWYWHLYALFVKVPLGTWGLFLLAASLQVAHFSGRRRRSDAGSSAAGPQPLHQARRQGDSCDKESSRCKTTWRDELVLLAPAAAVLALVSSQTGFSRYLRYVLPVLPFVFIWISSVARTIERKQFKTALLVAVLLAWSVGSSLWHAPHWMSYFNELAGGPRGGPAHLIDAQVDWGQDLLYLKKWLDKRLDARELQLAYFGPIDPELIGIEYVAPPKGTLSTHDRAEVARVPDDLAPGLYAVSVNYLYGYPYLARDGKGHSEWLTRPYYSYFRRFRPTMIAGYSIYIYHLSAQEISDMRP